VLKFSGISHVGKAGVGTFKLNEQQLGWVCTESTAGQAATVAFVGKEIASAEWQHACGKGRALLKLRFQGEAGSVLCFIGFRQEDFAALKSHMQTHFSVSLLEQRMATRGGSWFDWSLEGGQELRLMVDGKAGIDISLGDLSQISTVGKNELNLEFQEGASAPGDEVIHEMRLFVPSTEAGAELSAEQLKEELQKRTGLSATGEVIARIRDIAVVQPRGKHDFEFFQQAMKVHGKTQTYTVKYSSIQRCFLLEMPTDARALVIHLDQPLRQGQQLHSFLVLTFEKDRRIAAEMPEEMLRTLDFNPGEEYEVYSVVGKLIKQLSQKSFISQTVEFKNLLRDGQSCVRCSYKTQPGFLFPTKRSMIFVPKPVLWIKYDEIEGLEFKTSQMRKSSFDLVVLLKGQQVLEFSQLERGRVLEALFTFFQTHELKIVNVDEVRCWISPSSSRAKQISPAQLVRVEGNAGSASSNARPVQKHQDDDGENEDDEDYEEPDDDDDDNSSADLEDDIDEEEEPQKKRAKKRK